MGTRDRIGLDEILDEVLLSPAVTLATEISTHGPRWTWLPSVLTVRSLLAVRSISYRSDVAATSSSAEIISSQTRMNVPWIRRRH